MAAKYQKFPGVQVKLNNNIRHAFDRVKENLTRIGWVHEPNELTQVCYILHKRGKYYIIDEWALVNLDNGIFSTTFDQESAQVHAVQLLENWGLITPLSPIDYDDYLALTYKVIRYKDKDSWVLKSNYNIGNKQ